uniref:Odorant receptor n=1 Tax=Anopheles melas TaxID=34690 RepID=A0A182TE43_9DIPT
MILKMEFFYKNVSKIQQLIRRLLGKRYHQSGNAEEDIFLREVLDLFSGPLLAQLYCSVFILCITEFRLLTDVNTMADTVQAVIYLLCLVIQVAQYCYFGNEINYMVSI